MKKLKNPNLNTVVEDITALKPILERYVGRPFTEADLKQITPVLSGVFYARTPVDFNIVHPAIAKCMEHLIGTTPTLGQLTKNITRLAGNKHLLACGDTFKELDEQADKGNFVAECVIQKVQVPFYNSHNYADMEHPGYMAYTCLEQLTLNLLMFTGPLAGCSVLVLPSSKALANGRMLNLLEEQHETVLLGRKPSKESQWHSFSPYHAVLYQAYVKIHKVHPFMGDKEITGTCVNTMMLRAVANQHLCMGNPKLKGKTASSLRIRNKLTGAYVEKLAIIPELSKLMDEVRMQLPGSERGDFVVEDNISISVTSAMKKANRKMELARVSCGKNSTCNFCEETHCPYYPYELSYARKLHEAVNEKYEVILN